MELVRGRRITDYCDEQRCTTAERLRLLIQVCHAIQHAHHKGIIHRDIKPSNILIAENDGVPSPKVIDFGIAKATRGALTERTLFTAYEQFIGTPAYMSPEQVELAEADVDTRSDVYGLGVLLCELLTGTPPFETKELLSGGLSEMRRRIRETEPQRPSLQLRNLPPEDLATTAARHGTNVTGLLRAVSGDLDWIVLRCLEKERGRRYQSAVDLATDLARHLNHEPVDARPPGTLYVLRKFGRRHRLALAAAALITVSLVGTAAISFRSATTAREAERRAAAEAAAARQVIAFLQDDLLAPPQQTPVWDLKFRTVLDRAEQMIAARLADQPLVEATVRETLAATYRTLGEHATEQRHLERALALQRRLAGPTAPETLALMGALAEALARLAQFAEAEKMCRETLAAQRTTLGAEHPDTLRSQQRLASVIWNQGRLQEAARLHQATFGTRERALGRDHPDTLSSMQDVAQALRGYGEYNRAAYWGVRTLEAKRRVLGAEHPDTLVAMNGLGMTYHAQGKLTEARELHETALALRQRVLGPEHPDTLISMTNLADVFKDEDRLAEAEALTARTLATEQRTLGAEHPSTLNSMSTLGLIYLRANRPEQAAPLHSAVLAIRRRTLGHEHPETLTSTHHLGATQHALGNLGPAAELLTQALAARREILAAAHPDTLRTLEELGTVALAAKNYAEARTLWAEALATRSRTASHAWRTSWAHRQLGEALAGLGDDEGAERELMLAFKGLKQPSDKIPSANAHLVDDAGTRLVRFYRERGRTREAAHWADWLARPVQK
jgi:tetratricopeptide (TPR) repeat protein